MHRRAVNIRDLPLLRTLPVGSRFELPSTGKTGTLRHLGVGAAAVRYDEHKVRAFTPATGPNAGKEIFFVQHSETTTVSLDTRVIPLEN